MENQNETAVVAVVTQPMQFVRMLKHDRFAVYALPGVKGNIYANPSIFPGGVCPPTLDVAQLLPASPETAKPDLSAEKAAAAQAKAEKAQAKAAAAAAKATAIAEKATAAAQKALERANAAKAKVAGTADAPATDAGTDSPADAPAGM